jgi:hypothetical protein
MANRELFGKASTSNSSTRSRNFRLVEGSNIYRIAPAYGTLAASGRWFRFIKQHWGYKSAGDEANANGFPRLFICPEDVDYKTKMIRVACPECSLISNTAATVENRAKQLAEAGKKEDEINTILGVQKEFLKAHNLDKKYIVLAKNEKGEWGVLWLPFKAKEALDNRRKLIQAESGYDILDADDGAWINFTRSGTGFRNTTYACDVVSEMVALDNGKKARQDKQEALVDVDFDSIVAECPDLASVGRAITVEQIERLVEGMGDPDVVESVFNEGREASPSPVKKVIKVEAKPTPVAKPVVKAVPAPVVEAPVDDEEAALAAALADIRAKRAAKALAAQVEAQPKIPPAAIVAAASVMAAGVDPDNLSDDEFMKLYKKTSA